MDEIIIADGFQDARFVGVRRLKCDLRRVNDTQRVGHELDIEGDLDGHSLDSGIHLSDIIAGLLAVRGNSGIGRRLSLIHI